MKIWLDDVRPMPEGYDFWAKNAYQMVGLLISGNVNFVSFDHDLGMLHDEKTLDPMNTGYEVAKTIECWAAEKYLQPIEWEIHSANPAGRRNIELAMKSAERFWSKNK